VRSLLADRTGAGEYTVVKAPTLLLGGERSPVAARRVVELLAAALPSATQQVIEGAGHMGPITHADAVNRLIVDHIARSKD
jgi:pimeloyl-ACP methyl ester carboxylesterase